MQFGFLRMNVRGAVIMDCGGPLGAALCGLLIAHLLALFGSWRIVFAIAGIATILLSWLAWSYLRDNPRSHPDISEDELDHILQPTTDPLQAAQQHTPATATGRFGIAIQTLAAILTGRAAWAMMFFGLLTWGPNYLAQGRRLNLIALGNATFFIFMAGVAGSLCGGFLMDALVKAGYRQFRVLKALLLSSSTIVLAAFASLPYLNSAALAIGVLCIAAFFLMWGSIGGICVPIIVGIVLQVSGGYEAVLWFFAGCSLTYMAGSFLINIRLNVHEDKTCITAR